jgi:hypothetical protein
MTKDELLSQLENAKNNYILGLAAIALFANEKSYPILEESSCGFGTYTLPFDQVADLLRIPKDREIAVKEFIKMLLRALIKESFELIKDYCDTSNQTPSFTGQSWYQFARMIRNCISHNFRFEFRNYDRSLLPVSWKGKSITSSMDGTYLQLSFFGYVEAWELFKEMEALAKNTLV